jgi:glycosyltransferase involved in cell wall biosynthesis
MSDPRNINIHITNKRKMVFLKDLPQSHLPKISKKLISVIIIAYDRKDFIIDAINSVLNQSLDFDFYEIIVIKNYENEEIDEFINKSNKISKSILSNNERLGSKIVEALSYCNGTIVTFLEDDDLFLPNKLFHVFNLFINNADLMYYHNAFELINEQGLHSDTVGNMSSFNLSSISVKKDILYLDVIDLIPRALDTSIYINALDVGKKMISDDAVLTYYRVHESDTHIKGTEIEIFTKKLMVTNLYISSFEFLYKKLITMKAKTLLKKYIVDFKLNSRILSSYLKINSNIEITTADLFSWITFSDGNLISSFKNLIFKFIEIIIIKSNTLTKFLVKNSLLKLKS